MKNELSSMQMVTAEILRSNEHLQHEVVVLQTKLNSLNINQKEEEAEEVDQNQDTDLLNAFAWVQPKQKPCTIFRNISFTLVILRCTKSGETAS